MLYKTALFLRTISFYNVKVLFSKDWIKTLLHVPCSNSPAGYETVVFASGRYDAAEQDSMTSSFRMSFYPIRLNGSFSS